jgi:transitional endoplasmic reticulum ATPase
LLNDENIDDKIADDKIDSERFDLRIAESRMQEVGKRIARIDPKVASEHSIDAGDALEVASENAKTVILNWPAYEEDFGKGLIRIDGYERKKLGVGINDIVSVRKIKIAQAESITLAPTEPLKISGAEPYLLSLLEGRIVTRNDIVPIGIMGQVVHLAVILTNPQDESVLVTNQTEIIVSQVAQQALEKKVKSITYEDIGGLKDEVRKVREIIELPLRHPELFRS